MWSLLKRLFVGPPAPPDPYAETIRFDDTGFTRAMGSEDAGGRRQFWPWEAIHEFGFHFTQAVFPDPWFGDYMEGLWYVRVRDEGSLMAVEFGQEHLDLAALPPALLRHMPGLDLQPLRDGLAVAERGLHHFEGEGTWVAWRRDPHCA